MTKQGVRSPIRTKRLGVTGLAGSRLMPYLVAPLISIVVMPVALLAHWQWGSDRAMIAAMAVGATCLVGSTYVMWKRRHEHTRNSATVFAGAVLGWLVFAVATDPLSHVMIQSWLLGGIFISVLWGIRHASLSPHHEEDRPGSTARDSLMEKISSLKGGKLKKIDEKPGRVAAKIQLPQGEATSNDVQHDRARIASAVGMGEDEVTVTGVPGRADQVTVAFQLAESQKKPVKWEGPSAPGESIAAGPLVFGRRNSGEDMGIWLVGQDDPDDPRPLPHTLVTGVNGSGKTETWKTIIADMRWRNDIVPVVAGPSGKAQQDFGPLAFALGLFVTGTEDVEQFMRNVLDAVEYRQELFGSLTRSDGTEGYSQWEPEVYTLHGIPLVSVDIEEAADFLSGADDFDESIRKARSAGIALTASMQTAIHSNIERKTRGQFTNSLCHGCVEQYDARFSLSSGTLEKGADPTKWRNNYPGSLYGELVGTNQDEWADDGRAFYLSRDQLRAELEASRDAGVWAELDAGTFQIFANGLKKVTGAAVPAGMPPFVPEDQEQSEEDPTGDLTRVSVDDEEVDATVAIPRPKYDAAFLLKPVTGRRMSTEQARTLLEAKIDELEATGQTEIKISDLADFPEPPEGRSRAWIYGELDRLATAGRLTKNDKGKPPYYIRARVSNGHRAEG